MKIYVKQMYDWNCYAYCAEEVDEQYWDYFNSELWWQLGNSFIKTYDNVADFEYCAENFKKYGETAIRQHLKMLPTPWETVLDWLISEMEKLGADWYIHGSTAMALHGILVQPKDINLIVPNYSDYDKVRNHFYKQAIRPFERCENWLMSGLGSVFAEANIEFAFGNRENEPYDMKKLDAVTYHGKTVYVSTLEMLKQDNEAYGRADRIKMIEQHMTV